MRKGLLLAALLAFVAAAVLGGTIVYDHEVELGGQYDIRVSGSGKLVIHSADGWTQQFTFQDGRIVGQGFGDGETTILEGFGRPPTPSNAVPCCTDDAVDGWYYSDLRPGLVSRGVSRSVWGYEDCTQTGSVMLCPAIYREETKPCKDNHAAKGETN